MEVFQLGTAMKDTHIAISFSLSGKQPQYSLNYKREMRTHYKIVLVHIYQLLTCVPFWDHGTKLLYAAQTSYSCLSSAGVVELFYT